MSKGANLVHLQLRTELKNYIMSQYFGKSPLLLSALSDELDKEGILYQKPYIESSPAYKTLENGILQADLPDWMQTFFDDLSKTNLGIYSAPFIHQIKSLEATQKGQDLFVATGTGSGKTECFMWPLLAKLASEARISESNWQQRGIRAIIMYPLNALVSDQVSRLRKLIGDPNDDFINIFHTYCGQAARRPQFGMYTGRTPYPGVSPNKIEDQKLEETLSRMVFPKTEEESDYYQQLLSDGKIPAKKDMAAFLQGLHESRHIPDVEDAELITRFEMQQFCPDILITNYSMLELMLLRPREQKIWKDTKAWLRADSDNKLLFIIDEAHMYRGSSGGEVALLIRRLLHKLGISRNKVQFILTTASMPDGNAADRKKVLNFAKDLTSSDNTKNFCYLTGEREEIDGENYFDIPLSKLTMSNPADFEGDPQQCFDAINAFWTDIDGCPAPFSSLTEASQWMYDNLIHYHPFYGLIKQCRGNAVSLDELSAILFPDSKNEKALQAVSVLLAIAPLAKNDKNAILFPARMHMLFRGISGVYACPNEDCPHSHSDGSLSLGEILLFDGQLICPYCHSIIYEVFNHRRCGALFLKGYVLEDDLTCSDHAYLWRYPGQIVDQRLKELHLYIPPKNYIPPKKQSRNKIQPCYLDMKSGFLYFRDDSLEGKPGIRKLYYCNYTAKGRPAIITFPTCPHCRYQLSETQLTSFSTKGNQSFYNLIKTQFQVQPAVAGKANQLEKYPNEGRKVLLFSDSRQRAARLARDMSEASDMSAIRQLFVLAINEMARTEGGEPLNRLYDYFCLASGQRHIQLFHGKDREKFANDCKRTVDHYTRRKKRGRPYDSELTFSEDAPAQMETYLLRLYCGGFNTLFDSAISWIEPIEKKGDDCLDTLEEFGIDLSYKEFMEVFNAWLLSIFDTSTALGHTIPDSTRYQMRKYFGGYGLDSDWSFSKTIMDIMNWKDDSKECQIWKTVLNNALLKEGKGNEKRYVDLSAIKPKFDNSHQWYRCEKCSEITPYPLKSKCPRCGSSSIHIMTSMEYHALDFWRNPIQNVLNGSPIHVIDTEEHTAQLSHKDQRDALWSTTENYELRFQDLIKEGETPVDILSSTTTMEVGIDIGSLVAIGLRNIPPMRENYQQRAGRAGRRGSSLSTIITFCEDAPHDTMYFYNPVPMLRGEPRRPWIDIQSEKLLRRHICMITIQDFLNKKNTSLDILSANQFLDNYMEDFSLFLSQYKIEEGLLPDHTAIEWQPFKSELLTQMKNMKEKRDKHPELFGLQASKAKALLDALYEEGIIPTYSFPKNVVSTYIYKYAGTLAYQVERGLDVAIGEYAPGRSIVVDKTTYQIGGLYHSGSEWRKNQSLKPARAFMEDPNYLKSIISCPECGWFGLDEESTRTCPFCGNAQLEHTRKMLRPWGFAPKNAESIPDAQLEEEYTSLQQPLYSTLPDSEDMVKLVDYKNIRIASRSNQRIIMQNKGASDHGFMVCMDCGAAMPGDDIRVLEGIRRPYKLKYSGKECTHSNAINVNLGFDFITDMVVLEFKLDPSINTNNSADNLWLNRASQSFAEAFKLVVSRELDVEFTELVSGYRLRHNKDGAYIDIYLYDALSSGAGYAVSVAPIMNVIMDKIETLLSNCDCSSACHKCLKHYRNQYVHGILDRFAALDLLKWGKTGIRADALSFDRQKEWIAPLFRILNEQDYKINLNNGVINISKHHTTKKIVVYPAMWTEPDSMDTIYISDAYLKYAKPYALQKIIENI